MTLEVLVAVLTVVGLIVVLLQWWRAESLRVRQAVATARPDIYFHVGSISGPGGVSYSVDIRNNAEPEAPEAVVYLPSAERPALRPGTIHKGFAKAFSVSLVQGEASIRTTSDA